MADATSSSGNQRRIAVIPGDGIGKETVPEGLKVLEAVARRHKLGLSFDEFDFSSYDYYEKHGRMLPELRNPLIFGTPVLRERLRIYRFYFDFRLVAVG